MANKENFTFKSNASDIDVYAVKWIPEGDIKAVVQICHGMSEYIERYDGFARFLAENGVLVVGHDLLGHGFTAKNPDDYGYFADWAGNGKLVSDIFKLKVIIKKDYPDIPYFLLGHSFGSLLAREYIVRFKDDIDGVILMGTMNYSDFEVHIARSISKVIALFKGKRYRSDLIYGLAIGGFNKRYEDEAHNAWLTRNLDIVKQFNKDKMCTFIFTVGAFIDMFDGLLEVNNPDNIATINKELPILIMSGEEDPAGKYGKGVRKLYTTLRQNGVNARLKLYKNCRHELLNEKNKIQVYKDIYIWINKYISR